MFDSPNQRKYLWRVEFTEENELGKPKKLHLQFSQLDLNLIYTQPINLR